jgi:hypothetical protein
MERKEQIKQASDNYYKNKSWTSGCFIAGAEWSDANPNEENIAAYLFKQGWPLKGTHVPTYEEAKKAVESCYFYKKKQWIDNACEWLKERLVFDEPNTWHTDLEENYLSIKDKVINDFRKEMEELK